jgi:hypothetical protein
MEQVRDDDRDMHEEEHAQQMLHTLADMVTSRREGGPVQSTKMHYIVPAWDGLWDILLKFYERCTWRIMNLHNPEAPVSPPPAAAPRCSAREGGTKCDVPKHEDHYLLMNCMAVKRNDASDKQRVSSVSSQVDFDFKLGADSRFNGIEAKLNDVLEELKQSRAK